MGINKFFTWLRTQHWVVKALVVIAFLYCFLLGMGFLGASFKIVGMGFADKIFKGGAESSNAPFVMIALTGMFIGVITTSLIQSSSVTTSIVVGMVAAGFKMEYAVPIVMGANLGTTVTNTLVSLGHITRIDEFRRASAAATVHDFFNSLTILVMLPIEMKFHFLQNLAEKIVRNVSFGGGVKFESPVKAVTKPVVKAVRHGIEQLGNIDNESNLMAGILLVVAMIFIFLALTGLTKVLQSLMQDQVESAVDRVLSRSGYLGILIGCVVTATVQSSSITTSILVPLVAASLIRIEQAYPITLGANLGTTVTALLASAAGNLDGLTIALVHLLFNSFGILLFYPIPALRKIPIALAVWRANLVARHRWLAFVWIAVFFYLIPGAFILAFQLIYK